METYQVENDITLFGIHVATFPSGITEAFGELMKRLGTERAYYGISWCAEDNSVVYYAMAPETFAGEAEAYPYETLTLRRGEYRTEKIVNWMNKTDCIKDVFQQLMGQGRPDKSHPCIEWYQSDDEMLCMVENK